MPGYGPIRGYEPGVLSPPTRSRSAAMTIPQATSYFSATADFAAGLDTPREFLERCLARLEAFEASVGAFVCHDIAAAGTAADRSVARWRAGRPLSPIDGMPLGTRRSKTLGWSRST